jgi:hypothetical protein
MPVVGASCNEASLIGFEAAFGSGSGGDNSYDSADEESANMRVGGMRQF